MILKMKVVLKILKIKIMKNNKIIILNKIMKNLNNRHIKIKQKNKLLMTKVKELKFQQLLNKNQLLKKRKCRVKLKIKNLDSFKIIKVMNQMLNLFHKLLNLLVTNKNIFLFHLKMIKTRQVTIYL